jgi:hypothetical protein
MDMIENLRRLRIETWNIKALLWQQNFLAFEWWFIVVAIMAAYFIWWKLTDKRRIIELLLYGSFIAVVRVIFDDWGISSGRWTYVIDLVPIGQSLFLNDLTIIPLSMMLIYQYSANWRTFVVWLAIVQGATSFLLWPLLITLGILKLHDWQLYYSYIFVVATAIIMRAILIVGLNLQRKSRMSGDKTGTYLLVPEPALKPLAKHGRHNDDASRDDDGPA